MKLRCFQCRGPFGLTRRYHHCHAFCCEKCLEAYKNRKENPPEELINLLQYPPDKSYDVIL